MSFAYVDTSTLVAIAFEEPGGFQAGERLDGFSRLLSSNLLEAELRAAFARERQQFDTQVLSRIEWILPDRPLAIELARALQTGYLRGADLWHIATALYVSPRLYYPRRSATGSRGSTRVFRSEPAGRLSIPDSATSLAGTEDVSMASITISNLDDDVKTLLCVRAAGHSHSMERRRASSAGTGGEWATVRIPRFSPNLAGAPRRSGGGQRKPPASGGTSGGGRTAMHTRQYKPCQRRAAQPGSPAGATSHGGSVWRGGGCGWPLPPTSSLGAK